jgi:hypothetical protein
MLQRRYSCAQQSIAANVIKGIFNNFIIQPESVSQLEADFFSTKIQFNSTEELIDNCGRNPYFC